MSEEKKKEEQGPGGPGATGAGDLPPGMLPTPTFSTFILSMASSALVQLGEVPDPDSGTMQENLDVAKHTIDMLNMLQEKTEKGLDADERRLMEGILYELRVKYVMKSK